MKCISPIRIKGGAIGSSPFLDVPCGSCYYCMMRRSADWYFRSMAELKKATTAMFITLTYSEENLVYGLNDEPTLSKRDIQLFLKRLRKALSSAQLMRLTYDRASSSINVSPETKVSQIKENRPNFKYLICGEYGTKSERPHYHGLIFNLPLMKDKQKFIFDVWQLGVVHIGEVEPKSINYAVKYTLKGMLYMWQKKQEIKQKPFLMVSKGYGLKYLESMKTFHKKNKTLVGIVGGEKRRLPRYYRDKIFNKNELQTITKLFMQETERNIRIKEEKPRLLGENIELSEFKKYEQEFEKAKRKLNEEKL